MHGNHHEKERRLSSLVLGSVHDISLDTLNKNWQPCKRVKLGGSDGSSWRTASVGSALPFRRRSPSRTLRTPGLTRVGDISSSWSPFRLRVRTPTESASVSGAHIINPILYLLSCPGLGSPLTNYGQAKGMQMFL